ncbi:MAG: alpha/beta hydrolase [Anaerolineae bacterium]|jgi:proline iminopeptidase
MKKMLIIIALVVLVLAAVVGGLFWYLTNQPLYKPGMVRAGKNLRAPLAPPAQPDDEHRWKMEPDIELHHFSAGQGRDALIVHGGPGYPYTEPWPGLEPLTGDYAFHYYDQRGCGQSTHPIDTFSSKNTWDNMKTLEQTLGISAQLADIERIRRILGEEKLIVVGHSFGGFLASLYAVEFPEHVEGLVLIAPADVLVMPQKDGGLFEEVRERLPAAMQEEYEAYLKEYLSFKDIFSKSEADLIAMNQEFGKYYQAAMETPMPEQGQPGGWIAQAMYLSMGKRHDYRDALKVVEAPVIIIHGADDLQPEGASRGYAEVFPNARIQVVEDAAHFVFLDQPEAFSAVAGEFLDGLE